MNQEVKTEVKPEFKPEVEWLDTQYYLKLEKHREVYFVAIKNKLSNYTSLYTDKDLNRSCVIKRAFDFYTEHKAKKRIRKKDQCAKQQEDRNAFRAELIRCLETTRILTCSWGYDQTQVEYYFLHEVLNCEVIIEEIGSTSVKETSWASDQVIPNKAAAFTGTLIKKRIGSYGVRINSSINLRPDFTIEPRHRSWYA